jgi:hypothetical protein
MATWSDKKLQGHKRAQSYISSGTATLGIAALGAATAKTPGARKALRRVGGAAMKRGASVKTANRIAGAPDRLGNASTGLTTASAGFGGIGGYNFAAIQSQEAKKSRALRPAKKKPVMKMDTNPFDISKLGDRAKDNLVGAKIKPERKKEAIKTNLKEQYKGIAQHTAGGAAAGAAALGGTAAVLNAKTHGSAWKAAKTVRGARKAIGGAKGKGGGYGRKYALRAAKSSLTSANTRNAAGIGAYGGAQTGVYTGIIAGADKGHKKNRAAGNYQDRVKKTLSPDVAGSPFAKALMPMGGQKQNGQTEGKQQPSMRPQKSLITPPVVPTPGVKPTTAPKPGAKQPKTPTIAKPPKAGVMKAADWKNISEHQRRARDARRSKKTGAALAGAGLAGVAAVGGSKNAVPQAKNLGRIAMKHPKNLGRAIPKNKTGAALIGSAGVGFVGANMMGAGKGREQYHDRKIAQLRRKRAVTKAYDPERKRMKRLEGYSTAATAGGGAAGALGGLKIFDAAKQGKGLVQGMDSMTGKAAKQGAKAVARTGAKGLALGAAGVGGLVAGKKIKQHSRKGGRPYKQLPLK